MTKTPQLRGQNLLDAIEKALKELADRNEKFVYNASELARTVGCSRPTLNSKQDFIDKVLNEIGAAKRLNREHPLVEQLNIRIEDLESKNKVLEDELEALRRNHAEIFTRLYRYSGDMACLIKPIAKSESIENGQCILCSQNVSKNTKFEASNVVPITKDESNEH